MLSFPNCKINLGLHILGKRADGFHNLETVFYPLPFTDALELLPVKDSSTDITFTTSGLPVEGDTSNNLCVKAYQLLKHDFPQLPPVKMHLHKAIPMGAGLGGGSSDAAFSLLMLNEKFNLSISADHLIRYALQLGSDCPFFIHNKPSFATGRGENVEAIAVNLSAYKIILINPGIHINTGWAFSQITPCQPAGSVRNIILQPVDSWKHELINDFELPVFKAHPQVKSIKESLYNQGAIYASMSGSGSTVFGIFEKDAVADMSLYSQFFVKTIN